MIENKCKKLAQDNAKIYSEKKLIYRKKGLFGKDGFQF